MDEFLKIIKKLEQRIDTLERYSVPVPTFTVDPTGEALDNIKIWYNSTSNTFKVNENGVVKTITVT